MISGGVEGGDMRRSVLLIFILAVWARRRRKKIGRDYVEVSKASVANSQAREYNFFSS